MGVTKYSAIASKLITLRKFSTYYSSTKKGTHFGCLRDAPVYQALYDFLYIVIS